VRFAGEEDLGAAVEQVERRMSGWEIASEKARRIEQRQLHAVKYSGKALPQSRVTEAKKVKMSGNDSATIWAQQQRHQIWDDADVQFCLKWVLEVPTRRPNKTFQKGGRLMRMIKTLQNSCHHVHEVMDNTPQVKMISERKDDEVRQRFIAPLAHGVLQLLEKHEEEEEWSGSDESIM